MYNVELIGGGKGSRLQVAIAGLLDQVGHRDVRVRFLPRLLLLGPRGPRPLADQPLVLFGWTLPLGGTDQACREQGQDGVEDLLAAGLTPAGSSPPAPSRSALGDCHARCAWSRTAPPASRPDPCARQQSDPALARGRPGAR